MIICTAAAAALCEIRISVYFILMEFRNAQFDVSLIYETTRIAQPLHIHLRYTLL